MVAAVTAAIVALSRWHGMSEIVATLRLDERSISCALTVQLGMTADDIALQLTDLPRNLTGELRIEAEGAPSGQHGLVIQAVDGGFQFSSELKEVAALAARLLPALQAEPLADLADLAPAAFAAIEGSQPAKLPGLDHPLTSTCVDMTSGLQLRGDELEQRVNTLTALLTQRGAGPGQVVAVALPRGIDTVTAWVAILRSGATFLQLDPELPLEQRRHMVREANPAFILTSNPAGIADLNANGLALPLPEWRTVPPVPSMEFPPDTPAYLIFTSGSTGKPKAVMMGRAALDHHCRAVAEAFRLTPEDRVLSFAATGFDVAIEEVLPTLRAGATLVLRNEHMLDTLDHFVQELHSQQITVLNIPTAFWRLLTTNLQQPASPGLPQSLRLVIVGGERVPAETLRQWRIVAPNVVWMNGYGPTETTATAAVYVDQGKPLTTDSVPIGGPLGAARLALLSPDGSPAPNGRPGELWIGGAGVGLGYLNRPEQTAERFRRLPGQIGDKDQSRWYRTGDRCQRDANGDLVFLDRIDRQIKLSGYRIEPGGIETALSALPGVREVRVAVHHNALAVWVAGSVDPEDIQSTLNSQIPVGLSPRLTLLDEMPRNERGKLDEAALRAMLTVKDSTTATHSADPLIATIARIMGEVLGGPPLAEGQSFFDQGGTSLTAIELSERLAALLNGSPSLPVIYSNPSPLSLALALQNGQGVSNPTPADDSLMAIKPEGDRVPLLGIHVLGTNGEFYQPLANSLDVNRPVWGLTIGLLNASTPTDVDGAASMYFKSIQKFRPDGPLILGGVSLGAFVAFELAGRLRAAGRDVPLVAIFDADGPAPSLRSTKRERLARVFRRFREQPTSAVRRYIAWAGGELSLLRQVIRLWFGRLVGRAPVHRRLEDFIAANILSVASYQASVYPGRVVIFAALNDLADVDRVRKTALGWADVAPNHRFECVPGDHLGILSDPGVRVIARVLEDELAALKVAP